MFEEALTRVLLDPKHTSTIQGQPCKFHSVITQGFGLRVSPSQLGKPAFKEALMEVLINHKYTAAAQAMSAKIRARKNTPVQEAAGVHSLLLWQHNNSIGDLKYMQHPLDYIDPVSNLVNQILH